MTLEISISGSIWILGGKEKAVRTLDGYPVLVSSVGAERLVR